MLGWLSGRRKALETTWTLLLVSHTWISMEDSNIILRGLVLCIGLFVVLFHRLPYVTVVSPLLLPSHYIFIGVRLILTTGFKDILLKVWYIHPETYGLLIPIASIVRLLTINSINAYITSWVLYLSGGSEDPRLLLPAWISIATVDTPLWLSSVEP